MYVGFLSWISVRFVFCNHFGVIFDFNWIERKIHVGTGEKRQVCPITLNTLWTFSIFFLYLISQSLSARTQFGDWQKLFNSIFFINVFIESAFRFDFDFFFQRSLRHHTQWTHTENFIFFFSFLWNRSKEREKKNFCELWNTIYFDANRWLEESTTAMLYRAPFAQENCSLFLTFCSIINVLIIVMKSVVFAKV